MVTDKHNQIYTELIQYLKTVYPLIYSGTEFKSSVPKFPYVYFFQLDARTRLTTLSNTEDGVDLAFQIEVYTDNGMNKARKMSETIRSFMIEEGFRCRTFMPIQDPSNISRFVARYERLDV